MQQDIIPCAFFPTTVGFVDDDVAFLNRMQFKFGQKWSLKLFSNPEKAHQFFTQEYHPNPFTNRCILRSQDQDPDKRNVKIDIRSIWKEVYNSQRFSEIIVIVLDYMMPGLNGAELARLLKSFPFKIILLTGVADQQEAVDLFNQGIIHRYIRKDDPSYEVFLSAAVHELQEEYFKELSLPILTSLAQSPDFPQIWYKEPQIKKVFFDFCNKNKIVEYFLTDELGSYLLLTKEGTPYWFVNKNDKEIEGLIAHAEFEDAPSDSIVYALKSRKHIPYFHTDKDLDTPPAKWDKYFHPATKLIGNDIYYYSFVSDSKAYDIEPGKIVSYQDYLRNNAK